MKLCLEGGEISEIYDLAGIEGVRHGVCELNGWYYYV
jgi:hypothetical protein